MKYNSNFIYGQLQKNESFYIVSLHSPAIIYEQNSFLYVQSIPISRPFFVGSCKKIPLEWSVSHPPIFCLKSYPMLLKNCTYKKVSFEIQFFWYAASSYFELKRFGFAMKYMVEMNYFFALETFLCKKKSELERSNWWLLFVDSML